MSYFSKKTASARKKLFDFSVTSGIRQGQRDYTPFIILGLGRSGSNWLRTLLASHKNVLVFGELFNNMGFKNGKIGWGGTPGYKTTRSLLELRASDPVSFVRRAVFSPMPGSIKAVGFKIFYHQAQSQSCRAIWKYLREIQISVLHIKRRNLLASCLSTVVAGQTKEYTSRDKDSGHNSAAVKLDYETCLTYFAAVTADRSKYDQYFRNSLSVYYEDLLSDCEAQMAKVQDFLELPRADQLISPLKKQSAGLLQQQISNFDELKNRFSGTRFEPFFDE